MALLPLWGDSMTDAEQVFEERWKHKPSMRVDLYEMLKAEWLASWNARGAADRKVALHEHLANGSCCGIAIAEAIAKLDNA